LLANRAKTARTAVPAQSIVDGSVDPAIADGEDGSALRERSAGERETAESSRHRSIARKLSSANAVGDREKQRAFFFLSLSLSLSLSLYFARANFYDVIINIDYA